MSLKSLKGYVVKWGNSNIYFITEDRIDNKVCEKTLHTASQARKLEARLREIYYGRFEIKKL
jgi:hypothetical protein